MAKWVLKRSRLDINTIAKNLNVHKATATILEHRGIKSQEEAIKFLKGQEIDQQSIYKMKDGKKAIDFMVQAVKENKKIVVYGDYDVDGVTSTTILYKTLKAIGGNASYYLPHRQEEGYGLNLQAVRKLHEEGFQVIMTCDNGIASLGEIELANELSVEVVILDHHEPAFVEKNGKRKDILPSAIAIVDPKRDDCDYEFPFLCAGGISYYFALAILKEFGIKDADLEKELLVFATIATICDIVDLLGENRSIVKLGLKEIVKTNNLGLQALVKANNIEIEDIVEYHIGFVIGPCINATGRLKSGNRAVDLFVTQNKEEAKDIAEELVELNVERKEITSEGVKRIMEQVEQNEELDKVIIVYDEETHESVAGIIAGRIKDKYNHPTIVITKSEDGAKGSGRSIEGYHLFEAMFQHKELFTKFGGHAMAAGFSLDEENIPLLREKLNGDCNLKDEDFTSVYHINKILDFDEISLNLEKEISWFAPFGKENPKPLFASQNILIQRLFLMGKNKDMLKFTLKDEKNGNLMTGISFDGYNSFVDMLKELYNEEICGKMLSDGKINERIDLVYTVEKNTYQGNSSVQLMIKDFRLSKK